MKEAVHEQRLALAPQTALTRRMPLIPRESVAGRALAAVIAIMTFLACLTAGGALLVAKASEGWRSDVLKEVTIQVKPKSGADIESLVSKAVSVASGAKGVKRVRLYSADESARLLQPWLGDGLDLSLLPVPRLLIIDMAGATEDDLKDLREALASSAPEASLSDRRIWATRIGTMAFAVVLIALASFALMMVAMGIAIGFATRAAVAANREIIEVLHFICASDRFIAREFETNFRAIGLRGALTGGVSAMAFFFLAAALSGWWSSSTGGAQIAAMFGSFGLGASGYVALLVIGAIVTVLTGLVSRVIVLRHLSGLR
jgi:cell division transport system permease protein